MTEHAQYDSTAAVTVVINPVLRQAVLFVVAALVLIPLVATVLGGFKTLGDLRVDPFGLPASWQWQNYWDILAGGRYWRLMGNSLVIAVLTVVLTVAISAMAAFVFVHVRFFGSSFLYNYLLLGLMFPAATAILPLFIKIRDLGLLDTYWGVVLPQVAFGLAASILLFRNYFRQLPGDLFDAALIDGCGYFALLPPHRAAAVAADPGDGGGDHLRAQLERLPAAAGGAQPRRAVPVAAGHHGVPGRVFDRLAPGAGLHHADHPADDRDVLRRAAAHRRRPDGRLGEGLSMKRRGSATAANPSPGSGSSTHG